MWRYNPDPIDYYRQMYSLLAPADDASIASYIRTYKRRDRITYIIRLDRTRLLANKLRSICLRYSEIASGTMPWHALGDTKEGLENSFASGIKKLGRFLRQSKIPAWLSPFVMEDLKSALYDICLKNNAAIYYENGTQSALGSLSKYILQDINGLHHYIRNATVNDYRRVMAVPFANQTPRQLRSQLDAAEELDEQEADEKLLSEESGEVIMEFEDGYYWVLLRDHEEMELEGQAMRHCGTPEEGNYLISLRSPTPSGVKAHVTFEWAPQSMDGYYFDETNWGYIGEMKGRANTKPKAKYHPYIVELLRHPAIQVVVGGGYDPKNNFSLDDLKSEVRKELLTEKPGLAGFDKLQLPPQRFLQYLHTKFPEHKDIRIDTRIAGTKFLVAEYDAEAMLDLLSTIDQGITHYDWRAQDEARGSLNLFQKILRGDFWPEFPVSAIPYRDLIRKLPDPLRGAVEKDIIRYMKMQGISAEKRPLKHTDLPDYIRQAGNNAMSIGIEAGYIDEFDKALEHTHWECGSRVYVIPTDSSHKYILADPGTMLQYLSTPNQEPMDALTEDSVNAWRIDLPYGDPINYKAMQDTFMNYLLEEASPRLQYYLKKAKENKRRRF